MVEGLSARTRAALKHGAEGAARLRGEWLEAGRQVYHDAIREGRQVAASSERELEALGRDAMARAARLKAQLQGGVRASNAALEGARTRVVGAAKDLNTTVRRAGAATARTLSDIGAQVSAGQTIERDVIGPPSADIAGKVWSAPNTLIGLGYGAVGHVVGLTRDEKPYVTIGDNAIQFRNNPLGGEGAITLGNTTTYEGDPAGPDPGWARFRQKHGVPVQEHERQHTLQAQQLGPLYLPSNVLGGGLALLRDRDGKGKPEWHGPSNWNEWGPYETPPRPWPRRLGR
jgi:hypothetical protein